MKRRRLLTWLCIAGMVVVASLAVTDYYLFHEKMNLVMKKAYMAGYETGIKIGTEKGMRITVNKSIEAEALAMLFERYRLDKQTAKQYAVWVIESAIRRKVPSLLLAGLIMQESSCRYDAVSVTGAIGLTQVDWRWWGSFLKSKGIARQKGDLFNPQISIEAGAAILSHLLQRYDGNIEQALKHYSGGAKKYSAKIFRRVAWLK